MHVKQQQSLAHVLWLGGSPCAGKTSVAKWLTAHYSLQLYHYDKHEKQHEALSHPARHPAIAAYASLDMDERWVSRSVEQMVQGTEAVWTERFEFVLDDFLALPATPPILAEGPGLLPDCVAPLLTSPQQAIWLVPTEAFKRAVQPTRGGAPANQTHHPAWAYQNLIALDLQLANNLKDRAHELGLTVLEIDGRKSVDEIAMAVAEHFGLA